MTASLNTKSLALFFALAVQGCGSSSNSLQKIVGGTKSDNSSPAFQSTVAIGKVNAGSVNWYCSGTLVAPNLVITASHCLYEIEQASQLRVLFGNSTDDADSKTVGVRDFKTPRDAGYRYFPNFDVAWLKLAENAPNNWQPIEIARSPRMLDTIKDSNTEVLLSGYGQTSTNCVYGKKGCSGDKLEVSTSLTRYINSAHFISLMITGPTPGKGSCFGDSGGSAFIQVAGKWYLAGSLSGKSPLLNTKAVLDDSSTCESGESVYNFIGPYIPWIEQSSGVMLYNCESENPSTNDDVMISTRPNSNLIDLVDFVDNNDFRTDSWDTLEILISGFKEPSKNIYEPSFFTVSNQVASAMKQWTDFSYVGTYFDASVSKLRSYQLRDIEPFKFLESIKKLSLSGNRISNTDAIGSLVNLESLSLSNNLDLDTKTKIPWNLGFLSNLRSLRDLNLSSNRGNLDLSKVPWQALSSLMFLDLTNNAGTIDLTAIPWEKLPNLQELSISRSALTNIDSLSGALSLKRINLSFNKIIDVSSLKHLKDLEELDLSNNQINDFSPLKTLPLLRKVNFSGNPGIPIDCLPALSCTLNMGAGNTNNAASSVPSEQKK